MSYANIITFYGWSGNDVYIILKKLVNIDPILFKRNDDVTNKFIIDTNDKLKLFGMKFDIFNGGTLSDELTIRPYMYFESALFLQSANDDDIQESKFKQIEIDSLVRLATGISTIYPYLPDPSFITLAVVDTK